MAGILKRGVGRCGRCGREVEYEVIDMTGDGTRIDRLWHCPSSHRDTQVQGEYPEYSWENRRRR